MSILGSTTLSQEQILNGEWELRDEILTYDLSNAPKLTELSDGWIATPVPGDIHQGLISAGRIKEPLLRLNSFDCEWTERRSWWFRKIFDVPAKWCTADAVELEMNGLDSNAEIFVNCEHAGSHRNAFRPFVADVKRFLRPGKNTLLIRLTTGVENVSQADVESTDGIRVELSRDHPERGDNRRFFVRKPQYSFGWDWSPRVATTAIAGDVKIRAVNKAIVRNVNLQPLRNDKDDVTVIATVTIDVLHYYQTTEGIVTVTLSDETGRKCFADCSSLLRSGSNFIKLTIPVDKARLWWPNGLGEQHLYKVQTELKIGEQSMPFPAFAYGIRFVELDTKNTFAIIINGKKVFCKGANWIPADAIYARVDANRCEELVRQARDAQFNMLRVWGGGIYEQDAFYNACDRYGIMLWHDFMFACGPYPDHLEGFRSEVEKEIDYQTKRLRIHPSIVLWCGNNENNWGFKDWWKDQTKAGAWIYNYLIPGIVYNNCPEIPYWNGSPYGGDSPNCSEVGDSHQWYDYMMNPDMEKRITPEEYDKCTSLFVSEFGYLGSCSKETTLVYMDGVALDRQSKTWQHHTNTHEKNTVDAGVRKNYADTETLTIDEYLLYSGLCQGLMYQYALESMRFRANCHGGLFWMFNDCWGEVGWTIIDYYLRRKISWYFVRRSFAPIRLILRSEGDNIRAIIANDTTDPLDLELETGYISLDGSFTDIKTHSVKAPAMERTELCVFSKQGYNATKGLWIARVPQSENILSGVFRATDYRKLETSNPSLSFSVVNRETNQCLVEVKAEAYAHAVHFKLPDGCIPEDDFFDLLPSESRKIKIVSQKLIDPALISVACVKQRRKIGLNNLDDFAKTKDVHKLAPTQ
jgi:beta-mannosidase